MSGIDLKEVFDLVTCMHIVIALIALATHKGWLLYHLNVKSTFLIMVLEGKG